MNSFLDAALMLRETIMIFPLGAFCFIPVYPNIKSTLPRLICKILISIVCLAALMFIVYLILPAEYATPFNMLLSAGGFFWLYQREFSLERNRLLFVFTTACLIGAFSFLFYQVMNIFFNPFPEDFTHYSSLRVLLIEQMFEWFVVCVLYYPAKKHLRWLIYNFQENKLWNIIWIFPVIFTCFAYNFVPYETQSEYIGEFLKMYIPALIVLFVLCIFLYILFYRICYSMVERQRISEKAANLQMQLEQYRRLQNYVQETSRIRHDFRHELIFLSHMVKDRQYDKLNQHLDTYVSRFSDNTNLYCSSSAVNAVLNHYESLCKEHDINPCFSIHLKEHIPVADLDFCVLLGNLLENAVTACQILAPEDRKIDLKIGQTAPCVIAMQISNPYQGAVNEKQGEFLSTKHSGLGQGLKSVRMIAKKYNGFCEVCHENQIFKVKILLNF